MALADKKVLIVVPPQDFDGDEFEMTRKVLQSKGLRVTVASTALGPRRGTGGVTAKAETLIKDCKSYDYDAVIFIGGPGARAMPQNADVTKFAEDVKYKTIGAFSAAVGVLAAAKVVENKRVTGERSVAEPVRKAKGTYTGQPLEIDGKVITAESGRYAIHLANAVISSLQA